MKDGMEGAKWSREFQASGMSGDLFEDAEGADPLVIELLHRTLGRDIACVKPCEVVDFEGSRYRVASIFGRKRILFDGTRELFPEMRVEGVEIRCHRRRLLAR